MADRDPTCVGRVRHVLGAVVTVALDNDLAGIAPIYRGRLQSIGQIGSLVRIPQGLVDLVATVSLVGIAELVEPPAPAAMAQRDERWLQVQLIGEIDRGSGVFKRGVGSYPALDDEVHFATAEQLRAIFPTADQSHLRIGRLSASEDIPVCLDANRLVVRHGAIVGSTGAGKTSAVASLLQSFARGGWKAANIVVVDPHGEYAKALAGLASVRSVLGTGEKALRIPYWALPALEIYRILAGSAAPHTFAKRYVELVAEARKEFADTCAWLALDANAVTADTPIPFDIYKVWHTLDWENRETRTAKGDPATARVVDHGDPASLKPAQFEPYGPGGQPPHQSPTFGTYGSAPSSLRLGLTDPQLRFFRSPGADSTAADPLVEVVQEWIGGDKPISVLDFSGVPADAADVAIGVVLKLIFELSLHCKQDGQGIGRPSPVLVVLEEAHRYLGDQASALTRDAANRIAREGRKYGVGLLLVSQRPTELPDTALAQCGTIIALRLTNGGGQNAIRGALPDSVAGLASVLPSLRTGEAIVCGEALSVPARALLDLPSPMPLAEDPSLTAWRGEPTRADLAPALQAWRKTYEVLDGD